MISVITIRLSLNSKSVPFDPALFDCDDEFDAEEVKDMRKHKIRQSTRDLLLTERAKEGCWRTMRYCPVLAGLMNNT